MSYRIIAVILLFVLVGALGAATWFYGTGSLCEPGEVCVREWLSATSGWAAVVAAFLTIPYLSKQIRDADRHQKTSFALQVRRHQILATRTREIAYTAVMMLDLYLRRVPEGQAPDIREVDKETVVGIIHHLRDMTISTFEGEIANPMVMPAYGTSLIIEKGYNGDDHAAFAAPDLAKSFFENIAKQAESYLSEMKAITGRG